MKQNIRENLLIYSSLILVAAISSFLQPDNRALIGISPHPYFIYCIFLNLLIGLKKSWIPSIILIGIYIGLLHIQTDYEIVIELISIDILKPIIAILLIAFPIGVHSDRFSSKSLELQNKQNHLKMTHELIESKLKKTQEDLHDIKKRLISKFDTISNLYQISKGLNETEPQILSKNFIQTLKETINSDLIAIYKYTNKDLYELYVSNGDEMIYPKFVDMNEDIFYTVKSSMKSKSIISINEIGEFKSYKKGTTPVIAGPIYKSKTDEYPTFIICIFEIPFLNFTPKNMNILDVYLQWYEESLNRVFDYKTLKNNPYTHKEFNTLKPRYLYHKYKTHQSNNVAVYSIQMNDIEKLKIKQQKIIILYIANYLRQTLSLDWDIALDESNNSIFIAAYKSITDICEISNILSINEHTHLSNNKVHISIENLINIEKIFEEYDSNNLYL